jgi:hypothetical protein
VRRRPFFSIDRGKNFITCFLHLLHSFLLRPSIPNRGRRTTTRTRRMTRRSTTTRTRRGPRIRLALMRLKLWAEFSRPFGARPFGPARVYPGFTLGLPWVVLPTRISPEGAMRYGKNRSEPLNRIAYAFLVSSPFRVKRLISTNPG